MIKYYKLFDLINRKGIKRTELLKVISSPTLAKLGKGENVQVDIIDKICLFLKCQPSDIMEVFEELEYKDSNGKIIKRTFTPELKEFEDIRYEEFLRMQELEAGYNKVKDEIKKKYEKE